jgi:hypothetical protein
MTPLERLVTQALRLPIDLVQHIIKLNRDAAERAASTIFQKYRRGSRPRLPFRNLQAILGDTNLGVANEDRARWWRESWQPFYNSAIPLGPGQPPFASGEARRQFVAGYRRHMAYPWRVAAAVERSVHSLFTPRRPRGGRRVLFHTTGGAPFRGNYACVRNVSHLRRCVLHY